MGMRSSVIFAALLTARCWRVDTQTLAAQVFFSSSLSGMCIRKGYTFAISSPGISSGEFPELGNVQFHGILGVSHLRLLTTRPLSSSGSATPLPRLETPDVLGCAANQRDSFDPSLSHLANHQSVLRLSFDRHSMLATYKGTCTSKLLFYVRFWLKACRDHRTVFCYAIRMCHFSRVQADIACPSDCAAQTALLAQRWPSRQCYQRSHPSTDGRYVPQGKCF